MRGARLAGGAGRARTTPRRPPDPAPSPRCAPRSPARRRRWCWAGAARSSRETGPRAVSPRSAARRRPEVRRAGWTLSDSPVAASKAAAKPTAAAIFSVPARRPPSCPPPRRIVSSIWRSSRAKARAPAPTGPPSLCEEKNKTSAPNVENVALQRPTACVASQTSSPPAAWTSARRLGDGLNHAGLIVGRLQGEHDPPARVGASAASSAARESCPSGVSGRVRAASAGKRWPLRTQGCSPAASSSKSKGAESRPARKCGVSARLAASVAPLVKTRLRAAVPDARRDFSPRAAPAVRAPPAPRHGSRRGCRACPAPPAWPRALAGARARWRCSRDRRGARSWSGGSAGRASGEEHPYPRAAASPRSRS